MNIEQYASKPNLIEIRLDEKELVEKYGEVITFHTYDVVSMSTYFDFFNARQNGEFENLGLLMKKMILNKDAKPALAGDEDLPIDIAAAAINRLGDILGKSQSKTSTRKAGKAKK